MTKYLNIGHVLISIGIDVIRPQYDDPNIQGHDHGEMITMITIMIIVIIMIIAIIIVFVIVVVVVVVVVSSGKSIWRQLS